MKKGFTLIELIVVVLAIIGILTGVVMSAIGDSKNKTPKQNCLEKAKYQSISELPASCLQYINIPDWYVQPKE